LLAEKPGVKEVVDKELHSMMGLEPKEEDRVENQVAQLTKVIQQLQQIIADLELRTVPNIPQDV
jgi:hypothetical protein